MTQFARPISNITQTGFTGGFAEIDETIADDGDFAWGANNTAAVLEVLLSSVTDPLTDANHTFRYRIAKTDDGVVDGAGNAVTVTVGLYQGVTLISTDSAKTADGTWTQYDFTPSEAEIGTITDYADLRLRATTSASGGSPANRRGGAVSWEVLEVPDAPEPTTRIRFTSRTIPRVPFMRGRPTGFGFGAELHSAVVEFKQIKPPSRMLKLRHRIGKSRLVVLGLAPIGAAVAEFFQKRFPRLTTRLAFVRRRAVRLVGLSASRLRGSTPVVLGERPHSETLSRATLVYWSLAMRTSSLSRLGAAPLGGIIVGPPPGSWSRYWAYVLARRRATNVHFA